MTKKHCPDALRLPLGRAIKARRIAMGISQAELGARCRCGKASVAHIEAGFTAPSLGMLAGIAEGLDVEAWVLMREASEMQQQETST